MNALSLTQLKTHLSVVMRLMVANHGLYFDVMYRGRLYRMNIEDLNQKVVNRRRPRQPNLVDNVKAEKCPECKKLMLNNVCMSSRCPSNVLVG